VEKCQNATLVALLHHFASACHDNFKVVDFFAQGIAINAEQIGTFGLVAGGGRK
jgi:hypothetical protein